MSDTALTGRVQCAAIIAGGASRRMGQNKALLEFEGRPLVRRIADVLQPLFSQVVVVTIDADTREAAGVPAIEDAFPGAGPLAGLHAALTFFEAPTFCVACDMPFLNAEFIAWQCQQFTFASVIPEVDGRAEPLHAIYALANVTRFDTALQEPRIPSLQSVLRELSVRWVSEAEARGFDPQLRMFTNWNTPEEVRENL